MRKWIDHGPFSPESGPALANLLAGSYPTPGEMLHVLDSAGIDRGLLGAGSTARRQWHELVFRLCRTEQLRRLLGVVVAEYPALGPSIQELDTDAPSPPRVEPTPADGAGPVDPGAAAVGRVWTSPPRLPEFTGRRELLVESGQGHYFVSYSRIDSGDVSLRLADHLAAGTPGYRLWVDVRELQPWQDDWDDQIAQTIQNCRGVLFVMTPDSVRPDSGSKLEWGWALQYKKPVIALRLHPDAGLPFRLQSRQVIDFTAGFEAGLARLRLFLADIGSPQGVLRELRFRLADAERELPRAHQEGERARIGQELQELRGRIAEQERVVADPVAARAVTSKRIETGIEGLREPPRPRPRGPGRAKFVNAAPMTAPTYFQDRDVETELLAQFLRGGDIRLVTVLGRGGVGKTAMVCRLLKGVETGRKHSAVFRG